MMMMFQKEDISLWPVTLTCFWNSQDLRDQEVCGPVSRRGTEHTEYWTMDAVLSDSYFLGLRCVSSYPNKIQLLAVYQQTTKWIMHPVQ